MPFSRLLKKVVAESNMQQKDIVAECRKLGKKIDESYFSKILKGEKNPTEDLVRVLANVCNYDEKKLVLEYYFDQAPQEVIEALVALKAIMTLGTINIFNGTLNKGHLEQVQREYLKEPIANFIIEIINGKDAILNFTNINSNISIFNNELTVNVNELFTYPIKDNGMFPLITEKNRVSVAFQNNYRLNDILLIKNKTTEEYVVRYVAEEKNFFRLIPMNREYKIEVFNKEDIIIIGRVNRIVTEL